MPFNTFSELVTAVGANTSSPRLGTGLGAAVIGNILDPFCGGQAFTFSQIDSQQVSDPVITISGKAVFPQADLNYFQRLSDPLPVIATITRTSSGDADVTLVFDLPGSPDGWIFSKSFIDLPTVLVPGSDAEHDTHKAVLDHVSGDQGANLLNAKFVVKSSTSPTQITGQGTIAIPGLNFTAQWTPGNVLGVLRESLQATFTLSGPIVVPPDQAPPPSGDKFPWELEAAPGIHLKALLGKVQADSTAASPELDLRFQVYSPLLNDWLVDHPEFAPVSGFSGTLTVPDTPTPKSLTIAALKLPGVDEILMSARAEPGIPFGVSAIPVALLGSALPDKVKQALPGQLVLESVALWLARTGGSLKVEQIAAKFALSKTVLLGGSIRTLLGFPANAFASRAVGTVAGPYNITSTDTFSIAIDGAVPPINVPISPSPSKTTDALVSELNNASGFAAVAIAENIAGKLAITSGQPFTPAQWPFKAATAVTDVSVAVLNPFDSSRVISAALDGTLALAFGGSDFVLDVTLNLVLDGSQTNPEFEILGEQRNTSTVPLAALFDQPFTGGFGNVSTPDGFTKPPGVAMHDLRFSVTPITKAFALSFSIDVNGPKWQLGDQAVGDIHFSISNDGVAGASVDANAAPAAANAAPAPSPTVWELRAESPDGLGIANLFQSLSNPTLPPPLHDVSLKSFSISSTKDGFKADCSGEIPVDGLADPLAITIAFEKSGNSKTFSGEVVVAGIAFDLILNKQIPESTKSESASDSTAPGPPAFQLDNVLAKMLPSADAIGLPQVEISLDDVLVFYRKPDGEKGRALCVVDTGAGLKLNSREIGGVLSLLGVDLSLKLRLLAATGSSDSPELAGFTPDHVEEMNALVPDGIDKLPTEIRYKDKFAIRKGFDAVLKLGDFAFGADSSGAGANDTAPANTPNGGGQALAAAAGGAPGNAGQPGATGAPAEANEPAPVPADAVKWFSVQKSLGPVHVKRIGAGFTGASTTAAVKFALDASAEIAGLTVELDGFSIQSPLKNPKPKDIVIGLDGLGLSYQAGALEIGGQFLKDPLNKKRYLGAAVLKTAKLSITAFGAFGLDPTNLFVFAVLDYPLGGPTFFFVTGLAAGFGYNVDLKLPAITGVKTFPFVTAVLPAAAPSTTDGVLQQLSTQNLVPPLAGAYWVAAGIRFSSFQLIDSFALLFVKFGQDLEFMLLGLSGMSLPKNVPGKPVRPAYLNVELAFRVSVKPAAGEFAAEALLTENSFVFHPDCRLSGGFAFYAWFGNNPHAGDFVLTVGGYHPRFNVPAHYPQVPRLGINWPMDKLSIKGEAYFAITPSCIMAGGGLEASYKDGSLEASFSARADFLISWEPFFYDIAVSISLRAALTLDTLFGVLRLATELSAGIHIWGPEFAGTAHVTWNVISFDVSFGAKDTQPGGPQILKWEAFRKAFLPGLAEANKGWSGDGQEIVDGTVKPLPALQICQVNIESGLAREVDVTDANGHSRKEWVVLPNSVQFSTQTAIPASSVQFSTQKTIPAAGLPFQGVEVVNDGKLAVPLFGFAPMGGGPVVTPHIITITGPDAGNFVHDLDGRRQKMPKALWDTRPSFPPVIKPPQPSPAIAPSSDLLPDPLVVGLSGIRPQAPAVTDTTPIPIKTFAFTPLDFPKLPLRQSDLGKPTSEIPTGFAAETGTDIGLTIGQTQHRRSSLIALARQQGFAHLPDDPMNRLAAQAKTLFQSPPMLGHLGSGGTAQVSVPPAPALAQPPINEDAIATIVAYLISIFQYPYVSAAGVSTSDVGTTTQQLNSSVTIATTSSAGSAGVANPAAAQDVTTAGVTTVAVGSASQDLTAGQTVVLSVTHTRPRRPHAPVLEFTEGLNFRVAIFDVFGRPVQDVVVPGPQAPGRRLAVPLNAGRVAITGLAIPDSAPAPPLQPAQTPAATQTTFGWTSSSSLITLAPFQFLADGASVQTETSFQQSQSAGPSQSTVIRGSDLVRLNQTPVPGTAGNVTRSGRFRTLLPANVQTFAVLVRRSGNAAEPGLATQVRVTRADGVELHLQPVHVFRDAPDQFALLYRVPSNLQLAIGGAQLDDKSKKVEVVAQATGTGGAAGNWEIQGVLGITEKPDRVRRDWESFRLRSPLAVLPSAPSAKPGRARMTVVAA